MQQNITDTIKFLEENTGRTLLDINNRPFLRVRKLGVAQLGGCCGPSSLQRLR